MKGVICGHCRRGVAAVKGNAFLFILPGGKARVAVHRRCHVRSGRTKRERWNRLRREYSGMVVV